MAGQINAFEIAQQQFDKVADQLGLDEQVRQILRWPAREFHMHIPVRMDDGTIRVFEAFRVQHNDARGPNKGGLRFHPCPRRRLDACGAGGYAGVPLTPARASG